MAEFHRVEIPTPFVIGRVNCYVLPGNGLTVLDPGPFTELAVETLQAGLDELGVAFEDVTDVLITHPHMDHFGLGNRIVEQSGARVVAHRHATWHLEDPIAHFRLEQDFFRPFMRTMGVPEQTVEAVVSLPEAYTEYQEPLSVDRIMHDGDSVDVRAELTAVYTPGHAPGSVCFVDPSDAIEFTGDHVIQHITPNPLLTLAPGTEDERTRSLPTYLDSLREIRATEAEVGHSGHGDRISDVDTRAQETLDHHQFRTERIANLLKDKGPMTAFDTMEELFPDLPTTEIFTGMSEVIGHLDRLEDEERVDIVKPDGIREYNLQ